MRKKITTLTSAELWGGKESPSGHPSQPLVRLISSEPRLKATVEKVKQCANCIVATRPSLEKIQRQAAIWYIMKIFGTVPSNFTFPFLEKE